MKIAQCVQFLPNITGLYETSVELCKYLNRIEGVEAGLINVNGRQDAPNAEVIWDGLNGGQEDPYHHIKTKSFDWARDADVFIIHSNIPDYLLPYAEKAKTIFPTHGTPEYTFALELWEGKGVMHACIDYARWCDAIVNFEQRHVKYWAPFDDSLYHTKSFYVPKGIDLERYTPLPKENIRAANSTQIGMLYNPATAYGIDFFPDWQGNPTVIYTESWRNINFPMHLLYAAYLYYHSISKDIRLYMFNYDNSAFFWFWLLKFSEFIKFVRAFEPKVFNTVPIYRSAHMMVHTHWFGDKSRTSMEAMACGCPVIAHGNDQVLYNACPSIGRDYTEAIYDQIVRLTLDLGIHGPRIKERCRQLAEKYFDMRTTAQGIVDVCNELMKRPPRRDRFPMKVQPYFSTKILPEMVKGEIPTPIVEVMPSD